MKLCIIVITLLASFCGQSLQAASQPTEVAIETALGTIVIALDPVHAPITSANFLRYVDHGFYDGGSFHRSVTLQNQPDSAIKIEVIQAGINAARHGRESAPIS